jgi:hypothetical protein
MKLKFLSAIVAMIIGSGCQGVRAADLGAPPMRNQPVVAVAVADSAPSYRAFSCSIDAGAGINALFSDLSDAGNKLPIAPSGFVGAVGGGCDYRLQSGIVAGLWGNGLIGESKATFKVTNGATVSNFTTTLKNQYEGGVRVGYMVQPTTMLFMRGGLARAKETIDTKSIALKGYLVGGGMETKLFGSVGLQLTVDYVAWKKDDLGTFQTDGKSIIGLTSLVYRF